MGNHGSIFETHLRQCRKGTGIVLPAREYKVAWARQRRRLLEQPGIVMLDPAEMVGELLGKRLWPVIAEENCEADQLRIALWNAVGLAVIDHLQAVLGPA